MKEIGFSFLLGASLASNFKSVMGGAKNEIVGIANDIKRLEKSDVGKLGKSLQSASSRVSSLGAELSQAQNELKRLKAEQKASGDTSELFAKQIELAQKNVKSLGSALVRSKKELLNQQAAATTAFGSVEKLTKEYDSLSKSIEKANKRQASLSANLAKKDALSAQRNDLNSRLTSTVALGASVAAPVSISINFEDSMARAGALANATDEELAALTATARKLGRDTVFSASQAAEGMGFLSMAGFDVNETISAMPGMLSLASAGNTDLASTADIASNILSGFKLEASQMGMVADALAKTFTTSNVDLNMLGESMKYVAPIASSVGLSMQDTAAMVGLLGNVGIQGSQAGTALRASLLRLSDPPKEAADALAQVGLSVKDSEGNLRPFADILEELNAKTQGMGTADKASIFAQIFGVEASSAMIALADQAGIVVTDAYGNQTTALKNYMAQVNDSFDTSNRIAQKLNDTTGGSLRVMKSAMEDLAITTGNLFAPAVEKGAMAIVGVSNAISGFMQEYPRLSTAVAYLVGGIAVFSVTTLAAGFVINGVSTSIVMAKGAWLAFRGVVNLTTLAQAKNKVAMVAHKAASLSLALGTKTVTGTMWLFNAALTANPIGIIVVGIGALVAGMVYLYNTCEPVKQAFDAVFGTITEGITWAVDGFKELGAWVGLIEDENASQTGEQASDGRAWYDFWSDEETPVQPAASGVVNSASSVLSDKKEEKVPLASELASSNKPTPRAIPPMPQNDFMASQNMVLTDYQSAIQSTMPTPNAQGAGMGGLQINVPMEFQVQGLDSETFKKKMQEAKPDFIKIVKRIVEELQHNKGRVEFAN